MFTIYLETNTNVAQEDKHLDMQWLLEQYVENFKGPTQLPPKREVDHCIHLKDGIELVNVQPYRYAYFQKTEIEKQV